MEVLIVILFWVLLLGLPIALVVLVWVLLSRRAKQRAQAMQALAASQGWWWVAEDSAWAYRWNGEPFGVGDARTAFNVLTGRHEGYDFALFDYQYSVSNGKTSQTIVCGVWALKLPAMLPWLTVERQGALGQKKDVQFESEAFNRAYQVNGYDDRYAMAILHPRMMDLLMSAPGTYWRIDRDSIVYWEPGPVEPHRYVQRLNLLVTIAGLIPSYVWKDYGR